ncbi:hypothetical protein ACR0U8_003285 [Acinetobacter baumannii]
MNEQIEIKEAAYKAGFHDGRHGTPCELIELQAENERLRYLVGEKVGHPSTRDLLDAEINRQLTEQKANGDKEFMSDEDIEQLIREVLKDHDENPNKYWKNLYRQIDSLLDELAEEKRLNRSKDFKVGQLQDRITELLDERQDLYAQINNAKQIPDGHVAIPKKMPQSTVEALHYGGYKWGDEEGTREYFEPVYSIVVKTAGKSQEVINED